MGWGVVFALVIYCKGLVKVKFNLCFSCAPERSWPTRLFWATTLCHLLMPLCLTPDHRGQSHPVFWCVCVRMHVCVHMPVCLRVCVYVVYFCLCLRLFLGSKYVCVCVLMNAFNLASWCHGVLHPTLPIFHEMTRRQNRSSMLRYCLISFIPPQE